MGAIQGTSESIMKNIFNMVSIKGEEKILISHTICLLPVSRNSNKGSPIRVGISQRCCELQKVSVEEHPFKTVECYARIIITSLS